MAKEAKKEEEQYEGVELVKDGEEFDIEIDGFKVGRIVRGKFTDENDEDGNCRVRIGRSFNRVFDGASMAKEVAKNAARVRRSSAKRLQQEYAKLVAEEKAAAKDKGSVPSGTT